MSLRNELIAWKGIYLGKNIQCHTETCPYFQPSDAKVIGTALLHPTFISNHSGQTPSEVKVYNCSAHQKGITPEITISMTHPQDISSGKCELGQ